MIKLTDFLRFFQEKNDLGIEIVSPPKRGRHSDNPDNRTGAGVTTVPMNFRLMIFP